MKKRFNLAGFLVFFCISGCAQTPVVQEAQTPLSEPSAPIQKVNPDGENKACKETIKMVGSSNNFVRFKHSPSELPLVETQASDWCQQHEKSPYLQKQRCGVCCTSSYFCR